MTYIFNQSNPTPDPSDRIQQLQALTGLKPSHFADLVRAAQLIAEPSVGIPGFTVSVDWQALGVPPEVEENLRELGTTYRYASPYVAIDQVWEQLSANTRNWFFENRNQLWRFEEAFPALDED